MEGGGQWLEDGRLHGPGTLRQACPSSRVTVGRDRQRSSNHHLTPSSPPETFTNVSSVGQPLQPPSQEPIRKATTLRSLVVGSFFSSTDRRANDPPLLTEHIGGVEVRHSADGARQYLASPRIINHRPSEGEWSKRPARFFHTGPYSAHEHPAHQQDGRRDSTRVIPSRCASPTSFLLVPHMYSYTTLEWHTGLCEDHLGRRRYWSGDGDEL
jgi:hypothetical protein